MQSPPSYKTASSHEDLVLAAQNLTVDEKKDFLQEQSLHTTVSNDSSSGQHFTGTFNASRTLVIEARGIGLIRLPIPSSQIEIPIYNIDGTLAYKSTRHKRCSGDAVLSSPERGDLIASKYRFGPGGPPTLHVLNLAEGSNEIVTTSKWTSRTQEFVLPSASVKFQWRYQREREPSTKANEDKNIESKKSKLLVLEIPGIAKGESTRIAQLVRDDETRTVGTNRRTAGNGGALMIDLVAAKAVGIPEELIVSTCVMMLKKEMDRRRMVQIMVIAGAAGS